AGVLGHRRDLAPRQVAHLPLGALRELVVAVDALEVALRVESQVFGFHRGESLSSGSKRGYAATNPKGRDRMRRLLVGAAAAAAALVLAAVAAGITNGTPDGGGHPYVGALLAPQAYADGTWAECSGTLVAPKVFLTA